MAVCTIQTTALAATPAATAAASGSASVSQSTAAKTTAATTNTVLPCDVQTSADGTEIKKIYDVDKNTSPEKIPQTDFERGGFKYTFTDLLKIELPVQDKKVHTEKVTVASGSDKAQDVLALLPKSKEIKTEDGYTGTAYLDISTITTKVAGTESISNSLRATREYPGLSEMDMADIPKTITDGGHTLSFADVSWEESTNEIDNYGTETTTYTAVVTYTGSSATTRTTGYNVTATYAGEVSRYTKDQVRYIAVYTGEPLEAKIADAPDDENKDDLDAAGVTTDEQKDKAEKSHGSILSWGLCSVFALLALFFAFRPKLMKRMTRINFEDDESE